MSMPTKAMLSTPPNIVAYDARARQAARPPLRIGILLDDTVSDAWVECVLKRITAEGTARIALVVLNEATAGTEAPRRSLLQRVRTWYRNRAALGFELYQRLDQRRYQSSNSPTRAVDLTPLLEDVPVVRVRPRMTKFCDYYEDDTIAQIKGYDLDVALRFGFRILKGDALRIARHGVWSYHHGDNTVNRGGPAGFWEVVEQHAVTGAVLQRLTEDLDGGEVIRRSFSCTNQMSATANCSNFYWQASELLVAALRDLARNENSVAAANEAAPQWSAYSRRLYTRPDSLEMVGHFIKLGARLLRSKLRATFYREQWLMAYRMAPATAARSDVPDGVFYRFKELQPPEDRFWADPFPIYTNGRHFLFFEEHIYSEPFAHICVVEIDANGMKGAPRIVLKQAYHLSYPSVFEWEGQWYMTPETESRNAVELFRATDFPHTWEYAGDLINSLGAVDPTISCIDGRWWMFLGVVVPGACEATSLHIYSAPGPLGPWAPHARNPVKVDVRGARPGGQVFSDGGRYYRVGQDGAPSYGSGLRVFVIERLDDTDYQETEVESIRPIWRKGLVGTHTLNASGGLTVIDIRQLRRRK